jgi:WD40 repeat protein
MSAIFLSHSSADNEPADTLRRWLEGQGYRSFFLDFDPEQGIPAGRDWEKELYAQLRACRAIIVLCSPHSMASIWCFAEITHARALGKAIFPVKIADCPIHSLLTTLQVLDLTAGNGSSLDRLSHGLKAAGLDPTDSFDWGASRPPYPGLLAFDEPDAAVFFGRENEIREGLDSLSQQRSFGGARFLLVLGASGSGKSSLLRAGLIPRLRRNPDQWIIVPPLRPLGRPFERLAYAFSASFEKAGERREWNELHRLISDGAGEPLAALARELQFSTRRPEATVLLCIDQLEELFTLSGREEAERFLGIVRAAAEARASPVLVVATLRSDFLGALQSQAALREASLAQLLVNPMALGRIGQIIEGPAAVANLELEPGLVQAMLRDTEAESALPLLAFTLRELWEHRLGDRLTSDVYRDQLGGLSGAVAKAAEGVLTGAGAVSSLQETQLRQTFLSLVRLNEEGRFTRRPANWADLPEAVHPLLERFVQARLLISRQDGAARTLEVAHEALFRAWGRLAAWLDQDRAFLLWRKRLDQALEFWTEGGKSRERLLTGALLREAEVQLKEHSDRLSDEERTLIKASVKAAWRRRVYGIVGVVSVMLSLTAAAIVAWQQKGEAERQTKLATARQLAVQATSPSVRLDLALLESLEASHIDMDIVEGRGSLLYALQRAQHLTKLLIGHNDPVSSVTFSADGKTLASASDSAVKLWDIETGKEMRPVKGSGGATSLTFSRSGKTLASGSRDSTIELWNVDKGTLIRSLPGDGSSVLSVSFSPDEKIVASGSFYGKITLWDTGTGERIHTLEGHQRAVTSVAYSPDGNTLASGGADNTIILWDLAAGKPKRDSLTRHTGYVTSVAFNPDGDTLASGSADKTLILWDVATGKPKHEPFTGHTSTVQSVAFSPDGNTLASASGDNAIILWDVATGRPKSEPLTGHIDSVQSVAFSPDGKTLASGSADKTIMLWDVATPEPPDLPLGHTDDFRGMAFSPDGKTVAIGSGDSRVRLWDLATRRQLGPPFTGDGRVVGSVTFSADGKTLASSIYDTILLWDVASHRRLDPPLIADSDFVQSVSFSADGKTLASGGDNGVIRLWDVTTRHPLGPSFTSHTGSVTGLAFSADGNVLASGSNEGTIMLWDVASHRRLEPPLTGQSGVVRSVTFSADSKTLATGSSDGTIRLWDVTTRQPLGPPLTGHTMAVWSVAFKANDKTLASGSQDGRIILWDVSLKSWQERACRIANRNFARAEWKQYIGDIEPYSATCPDFPFEGRTAPSANTKGSE